jgi:hypothetical protein
VPALRPLRERLDLLLLPQGNDRPALDVSVIDRFAREWRPQQPHAGLQVPRLGGFCLLLKRQVLEQIGPLEPTGLGLFDTELLCQKARQAGFELAVCQDLFVHHFASRIFAHGASNPDVRLAFA